MSRQTAVSRRTLIATVCGTLGALALGVVSAMGQTKPAAPATQPAASQPAGGGAAPAEKLAYVQMTTNNGVIVLELNAEKAPITVKNFLAYTDKKFYDNTIFHRVIPSFMVQGGGFGVDKVEKRTDAPISNEAQNGLKNVRGSIAMARTNEPNSATSQFFINVVDNYKLDASPTSGAGYAVFGKVVAGLNVADVIVNVPTHTEAGVHGNWPNEPVIIQKVERISADAAKKLIDPEKPH